MQYNLKSALNFIKFKDILHIFAVAIVLPWALIAKIFIRDFWLVCEEKNEARDNGYWLFKWIRDNKPKQKIAYAINKKSPDYEKVRGLGRIISYGTFSHWFWYIVADRNISSQKGGKPNAAVCYFFEVVLGIRKKNRVFLQHGVIINKLEWLFYNNTKMRLFMTSARQEYDYVSSSFGYPQGYVRLCGLTRFDGLHDFEADNDLILVMPTWRNWLGRESHDNKGLDFKETEYCIKWNEFLNSRELDELLKKYDKKLLFYPHRNMQKFLEHFSSSSERIEIADWRKYDIQEILKRAACMITDYSSVFFDFAYMRKPVIFYQFDETEFRRKQYEEGYFDYHNTVLGEWGGDLDSVVSLLKRKMENNFERISEQTVREFFPLWDARNCERTFEAISKLRQESVRREG